MPSKLIGVKTFMDYFLHVNIKYILFIITVADISYDKIPFNSLISGGNRIFIHPTDIIRLII